MDWRWVGGRVWWDGDGDELCCEGRGFSARLKEIVEMKQGVFRGSLSRCDDP